MSDRHIISTSKNRLIFSSRQMVSRPVLPVLANDIPENTCESSKPLPSFGPYVQAVLGIWAPSSLLPHVFVALCLFGLFLFLSWLKQHFLTGLSLKALTCLITHACGSGGDLSGCVLFIYALKFQEGCRYVQASIMLLSCFIPVVAPGPKCSAWSPQPAVT